jgi:subfamily B ATP-binding cassette protein HlyB/CyaB
VIMGPSGCGKSTLAKLMLGFYQPQEGQINLDGRTSGTWPPTNCASLRRGAAGDGAVLRHALRQPVMAHPHASFEDVIAACKAAEIHEVIEKLPPATRPRSASAAPGFRAARSSASPSPGRCSSARRS